MADSSVSIIPDSYAGVFAARTRLINSSAVTDMNDWRSDFHSSYYIQNKATILHETRFFKIYFSLVNYYQNQCTYK